MFRFRFAHLLYAMSVSLPLWGFSIINLGQRGLRIDWVVATLVVFLFVFEFSCHNLKLVKDTLFVWLLMLHISILICIYVPLASNSQERLADYLTTWLQFMLGTCFFVVVCNIKMEISQLVWVLKLYIIVAVIVAFFGIIQLVGSYFGHELRLDFTNLGRTDPRSAYEVVTGPFRRPTSFFSEPRQFGNFLVPLWAIVTVVLLIELPLFRKRISFLFSMIMFLGIIGSLALSAYFTILASGFTLWVYFVRRGGWRLFGYFMVALSIVLIMSFGLRESEISIVGIILRRIHGLPDITKAYAQLTSMEYGTSGLFRYVGNIRLAYEAWVHSPLIGVGLNNLEYYSEYGLSGAHAPFRFLAETGILGMIFFLGLIIAFLKGYCTILRKTSMSNVDKGLALIGVFLLVTTIIGSFGSTYSYYSTFFWFNVSLVGLIYFNLKRNMTLNGDRGAIIIGPRSKLWKNRYGKRALWAVKMKTKN